jgi:hypothetical protein
VRVRVLHREGAVYRARAVTDTFTRDHDYYDGAGEWCRSSDPPPGDGWIIADDRSDKCTISKRTRLIHPEWGHA